MKLRFFIILGFCLLSLTAIRSQDLHFTYFQMSPLTLNPGLTGAFEGTFRAGAYFRGQWLDVSGYKTPVIYVDAPVIRGLRETDWVGAGISFFKDQTGSGNLTSTGGHLSLAYHFGFGKDAKTILSLGFQYGSISRKIGNAAGLTFRDELLGPGSQSLDKQELIAAFSPQSMSDKSSSDYNVGIMLNTVFNNETKFKMGVMAGHITTPNISLLNGQEDNDMRITGFAQLTRLINSRLRFKPAMLYQTKGNSSEFELHGVMGYLLNPAKGVVLNGGLGYRLAGSAQLILGVEINDLKIGAAYDINTSGLQSAPGLQSAFEIGASYIFKIFKKPSVKPVIFCPRF